MLYGPFFKSIHYCGRELDTEGTQIMDNLKSQGWNLTLHHPSMPRPLGDYWWALNYLCIIDIQKHYEHAKQPPIGYLFIGDDVLIPPAHCKYNIIAHHLDEQH